MHNGRWPMLREEQVRISDRNVRVQQWKELFLHLETGMADRPWDFNQVKKTPVFLACNMPLHVRTRCLFLR